MKQIVDRTETTELKDSVVIVSGLPRSGTSMMMQMLHAGGLEIYSDKIRKPDVDNPKGYYEAERVKELDKSPDKAWVGEARGKTLKVISQLLPELPSDSCYKVIFMSRDLDEVIASQNKMLKHRDKAGSGGDDNKIRLLFEKHLKNVKNWLRQQDNFEVLYLNHREVIGDPLNQATRIQQFLQLDLDLKAMTGVVDKGLYRNRKKNDPA